MATSRDTGRDTGPKWSRLPDGRWHAQHGPIDLLMLIDGSPLVQQRCLAAARASFESVLTDLVDELNDLRREIVVTTPSPRGAVARRMHDACLPYRENRVSPMASVAGSVADHVLAAMRDAGSPSRLCVNNGGDIALHLAPGATLSIGVADVVTGATGADVCIRHDSGVGGIATSGWRGRSHSLGIADAVTVLASSAADADVAATLIANAVDLPGAEEVHRRPAAELSPESDLGTRPVTVRVQALDHEQCVQALAPGESFARQLIETGKVLAVRLQVQSVVSVFIATAGGDAVQALFPSGEESTLQRVPVDP